MPQKYSDAEHAWEIFVQLVGNGRCRSYHEAAEAAFDAAKAFDSQCQRRHSEKSKTIAKQPTDVFPPGPQEQLPKTHTQKPAKPTTPQEDLNTAFGKAP